jgi:hypothetical protein
VPVSGSRSLIPAAWTDLPPQALLASVGELFRTRTLVEQRGQVGERVAAVANLDAVNSSA